MADQQQPARDDGRPRPYRRPEAATEEPEQGGTFDGEPTAGEPAPQQAPPRRPSKPLRANSVAAMVLIGLAAISLITVAVRQNWPGIIIAIISGVAALHIGLRAWRGPLTEAEARFRKEMERPVRTPDRVNRILAPNERVYAVRNEHALTMTGWFAVILFIQGLTGYFTGASDVMQNDASARIVVILWCAAMVWPAYKLIEWRRTVFVITNKNVLLFKGVFSDEHNRMPLAGLTDAKAVTPFHSKWLAGMRWVRVKYGTFTLESAGQDQAINKVGTMEGIETLEYILMSLVQGDDPYPFDMPPGFDDDLFPYGDEEPLPS